MPDYRRELIALWSIALQVPVPRWPQDGLDRLIESLSNCGTAEGKVVRHRLAGLVEAALDLKLADRVDPDVLRDLERGV